MTNIWRLTKIQLLASFGLNKALHTQDEKEKRKLLLLSIAILFAIIMVGAASFAYSWGIGMLFFEQMELLLAIMMAVACLIGFFTTIYKASGVLFSFKDYDLVMSLPIPTSHVVASRVLQLYVLNLFFALVVMVPAGAVYAIKVNPAVSYYLFFILTLFFIPLIPLIAATIIGALISFISSRFKGSRAISLILTIAVLVVFIVGSLSMSGSGNEQMLIDMSVQWADMIYKIYPPAVMYVDAVCSYDLLNLVFFIGISVIAFILFALILGTRYKAIYTGMNTSRASSKFKMRSLQTSSPFVALYKKELRRFLSSSLYVLNVGIGMILLLVMAIALVIMGSDQLGQLIEIPGFETYLSKLAPFVVSMFVVLSCSTASSISLEGKNIWIIKSSPVSKLTILLSKIAVNLTITVPVLMISSVLVMVTLRTGWVESLFLLILPILYAIYSAALGILINLKFPNLEWTSEVTAIKQSASVMITMLIGFISLVVPAALTILLSNVNGNLVLLGIGLIIIAVCAGMYRYMKTNGERLFQGL
ncbi:hypothetical protein E0485_07820 [Paenibacillus albiflavus]|uniref:Uncharacterized protein n=1 Tax=Paenibacillus albiflavus TaxID=2545760 RepID=A0A4V2WP93_9BACL|nr:hypothetical protein [Paenibacillus albiflavus]TCZ78402.1 hypothetical protein E0485_07820 [Paenibacillus albiflavus]